MSGPIIEPPPFFEGVRPEVWQSLIAAAALRRYAPGEVILQEGDLGRSMLLIVDGQVEVVKGAGRQEVHLSQRGPGEVFGEMAFFEAQPRFATVRAVSQVQVLEMSEASLRTALATQPELLYHTTQVISARLRHAQQKMIADLTNKNEELQRAYAELQAAQAQIIEKERLERELELAREIQFEILPADFPPLPHMMCAAAYHPARQVGGDFYDLIPLEDGLVGLVMADVSDKGMPAALFMALSRSLLRAEARRSRSPAEVLCSVNRLLSEISTSDMFVTVFYGVLDPTSGMLTYARAGHDRPLHFQAALGGCSFLEGRGMMLGVMEPIELEERRVRLLPGDRLVLYTDGVTDLNDPEGRFYGAPRLQDVVCASAAGDPQHIVQALVDSLFAFRGPAIQFDDIAIMALQVQPETL